jgi:arginyl-tRNA synthetase
MYILTDRLTEDIQSAFLQAFEQEIGPISLQPTRKDFAGHYTLVMFPYLKATRKSPEESGKALGEILKKSSAIVKDFNVVKGFLNIEIKDSAWVALLNDLNTNPSWSDIKPSGREMMVEFSSPNTNKPLHLGHLRNIFLGYSVAQILEANGDKVHKVQIINDRGIHICKSMVAWLKYGEKANPSDTQTKGDKFVGNYYVKFDQEYKKQIEELVAVGDSREKAEKEAPIMVEAQEMLRKWEDRDPEVYSLWQQMNEWVYAGFEATYKAMGVSFDKLYYESDTYLLGKDEVLKGVKSGIFYEKDDGSVWVDLTKEGLDQKLLLRADGTSVYMTQDIGTAIQRFKDFPKIQGQVYTVGNEQDYHFKVLFLILGKLGYDWAEHCYHLSYGMVDLPSGKMKSREGTVVDADDLMQEMVETAEEHTKALGKIEGFTDTDARALYKTLGLGALKYFLLKIDPKKRMLFDPQESIQFQGNTGPFIQYTHARIISILNRAKELGVEMNQLSSDVVLTETEMEGVKLVSEYNEKVAEAGNEYSPAVLAQYIYDVAKEYNRFYAELPIFKEEDEAIIKFRVIYSKLVAQVIKKGMDLLGIEVPDQM